MKKIIDFATHYDKLLWEQYQTYLLTTKDELKHNYIGLNPRDFECFPVVIKDDKIVCFSALQVSADRWGSGIGRVSTRMWIHPEYRHGLTKFAGGDKYLNTTFCLPLQLAKARMLGLDCVFISREHNFLGFQKYLELIKINCSTEFLMEPNKYNVCGSLDPIPESCKQWVAVQHLTDTGSSVWTKQMNIYKL